MKFTPKEISDYWEKEGLNLLLKDCQENTSIEEQVPLAPQIGDLARLHYLIRSRMSFTVLEFGIGFSTIVIADALHKNKEEWSAQNPIPKLRNSYMFKCFTVDTSPEWIALSEQRIPEKFKTYIDVTLSKATIGTFNDQVCHFYEELPNIIPDFIYLDGPDPKQVEGNLRGINFQCPERTVMSGDLLYLEPTLLPETMIFVDGRVNNIRFLMNNFKRNFVLKWYPEIDLATMELKEERLGKYNLIGSDFFNADREL